MQAPTHKPIRRLLVANRGEIARRIFRTCRAMGIETVAVYSDADADALHVREADVAVRIGPAPATESYLDVGRLIDAARRTGADALHPGYGFLSERAELAAACGEAGIVFVGPGAEAIARMGSKREARRLAEQIGVPVVPGYDGEAQDIETLLAEGERIGVPLLVKASAGGGGKGMRLVQDLDMLREALEGARREAEAAFGDGTLLLERYVQRPRHVEVQILGDRWGHIVHLHERECTIQRRHQKIVEESPSTALDDALRARMTAAAVALARAIDYQNAGTVEFVVDADRHFYFLEVNTRLQVEHPVTEMRTGLDLVREQIRIAQGEPLGYGQPDVRPQGHAIEVRLYAEDPASGFLPQSGRLAVFDVPEGPGVRVDAGVGPGSDVPIHYDPLLAKVIAHASSRDEALARLIRALRGAHVAGIRTNLDLLVRVLDHPAHRAGDLDTHFLQTHFRDALGSSPDPSDVWLAAGAAVAHRWWRAHAHGPLPSLARGFRLHRWIPEQASYELDGRRLEVRYAHRGERRFDVEVDAMRGSLKVAAVSEREIEIEHEGIRRLWRIVLDGASLHLHTYGVSISLRELEPFAGAADERPAGAALAPMHGRVRLVCVREGESVQAGDVLVVLEAMKMEHAVRAERAGRVERVLVAEGDQ
ncbi:MAG: biotin carboxylase N-terminal domain-containing protein, partial [Myxococcales bacterium]|nr:biotin carboxylase N-terminal domain-containing protein [Myxococcales bacterium]